MTNPSANAVCRYPKGQPWAEWKGEADQQQPLARMLAPFPNRASHDPHERSHPRNFAVVPRWSLTSNTCANRHLLHKINC
jgi:hypothetical protein